MLFLLLTMSLLVLVVQSAPHVTSYDDVIQIGVYKMSLPADTLFQLFKDTHERSYEGTSEEQRRRDIFADNVAYINKHNVKYVNGESTYYLGINQFTDMTYKEFVERYATCSLQNEDIWTGNASIFRRPENYEAPSTVDWRKNGYVTSVKNQGSCGSCWSFSATGSIEGQHFRKTGRLVSLSEQQLVDCSRGYGNVGCSGGSAYRAFQYVIHQGGIEGEADYGYTAKDNSRCLFSRRKVLATIRGYYRIPRGEWTLETAVATVGPISVSFGVNDNFKHYRGGVFDDPSCSSTVTGHHAVLVVGYGSCPTAYWLVKNSWGTTWGEAGYIRMAKNGQNMCGIASNAVFPYV